MVTVNSDSVFDNKNTNNNNKDNINNIYSLAIAIIDDYIGIQFTWYSTVHAIVARENHWYHWTKINIVIVFDSIELTYG